MANNVEGKAPPEDVAQHEQQEQQHQQVDEAEAVVVVAEAVVDDEVIDEAEAVAVVAEAGDHLHQGSQTQAVTSTPGVVPVPAQVEYPVVPWNCAGTRRYPGRAVQVDIRLTPRSKRSVSTS